MTTTDTLKIVRGEIKARWKELIGDNYTGDEVWAMQEVQHGALEILDKHIGESHAEPNPNANQRRPYPAN